MTDQELLDAQMPAGVWIQVYRAKVPSLDALKRALDVLVAVGVRGLAWHGFTHELGDSWHALEALCSDPARNLLCGAAFGLNSDDATGKGRRMAAVALQPGCRFVIQDSEGAAEDENPAAEAIHGLDMRQAFRADAPDACVVGQFWPLPQFHWSAFPWEEFSRLDNAQAPQYYVNDWMKQWGPDRYKAMWPRFEAGWRRLDARLAPKGLVRPRFPTIQGYAWELPDLVDCLCRNPRVLMWCEPFPDGVSMTALRTVQRLGKLGFRGADAVKAFQTSAGLAADGVCGPLTRNALGL